MSFFDETVLDRSTLESAANCPMGARLTMDHKLHAGHLAAAGEEYHQCVSKAITDYLASADRGDNLRPGDVADLITDYAARSRPDVQQDVLTTAARSAYAVGTIIAGNSAAEHPAIRRRARRPVRATGCRVPRIPGNVRTRLSEGDRLAGRVGRNRLEKRLEAVDVRGC